MATTSSLISKIQSALHSLASNPFEIIARLSELKLKIGLGNLKVFLICLRNTGDDDTSVMKSLFTRIEDAIGRIPTNIDDCEHSACEIKCLATEMISLWSAITMPNRLTLDDAVEVADSILLSITVFWGVVELLCWGYHSNQVLLRDVHDVMDGFEVQTRFLRDFLLFARQTGVEIQQMRNLMIHIRPFVLDVSMVFQIDTSDFDIADWVTGVQSKLPRIDLQVFQAYIETLLSMSTLDQADDGSLKDFIGSLISILWHVMRYGRHPLHFDSLKALYEGLRLSRSNLKQQRWPDNEFQYQARVLICDAGILICSLYLAEVDSARLSGLLRRLGVLQAQILPPKFDSLMANALDFGEPSNMEDISDGKLQIENVVATHQRSNNPRDVGFQEDEVSLIFDRLTRGPKQLHFVPISGMAGLGKTTFALKVYNHISVKYHFQARAWCTISQVLNKRRVLLQLLNQIQPGDYSKMDEDDLANKLRKSLKQKRYLIFLDDVWTPQVWDSLSPSFPDDATQSRMLLTSRLHSIVPSSDPPHFLRLRKESECLEIIEMKLSHSVCWSTQLRKFAKLCKGLPLTAILVAGLLENTVQEGWEGILNHLSVGGISGMEQCKIALEFSYQHLSYDLKLCFMYFGTFPEDEEIYTSELFRLWIAEGFVAKKNDLLKKRIEDVAREYLDILIQRNLVMVDKKRSIGGVKTCRIHDLLHDFCMRRGMQENLFHCLVQRNDEVSDFNEPYNMERLSIHSTALHFKESRLLCPRAHSMSFFTTAEKPDNSCLFDMVFIIQTFKHLKVLNIERIPFKNGIPRDIAVFTRLTYLSITCWKPFIPSSIGNLSNLETLIIKNIYGKVVLPYTVWNLEKLIYIYIMAGDNYGFSFPVENIENSPRLLGLETICGVEFRCDGSMENQMRKFPNIRTLKCNVKGKSLGRLDKIVVIPEFLSQLEELTFSMRSKLQIELDFGSTAEKIRKLKLDRLHLSREEIAMMGKFPNLEVFKLRGISFLGGTIEMEEGEFLKLRILEFREFLWERGSLETWIASGEEPLPCLQKVVFRRCQKLKEIPCSCLEASSTLEEIDISYCSSSLESLVREIVEVHEDFGNFIKLQIISKPGSESKETEKEEEMEGGILTRLLSLLQPAAMEFEAGDIVGGMDMLSLEPKVEEATEQKEKNIIQSS